MKTSRLYLIVTGQVKATEDEAALIMQSVCVAHESAREAAQETLFFDVFCKDTLKNLNALTAETEEFP